MSRPLSDERVVLATVAHVLLLSMTRSLRVALFFSLCALVARPAKDFAQVPSASQSLESLSEEMGQLGTQIANRQAANDERNGEIAALQLLAAHTLMQADSTGLVARHGSGWFKYGYYSMLGAAMADRAHGDRVFAVNVDSALYFSGNLDSYDSLIAILNQRWMAKNIPVAVLKNTHFAYAFYRRESRYLSAERMEIAERIGDRMRLRRTHPDSNVGDVADRVYDASEVDHVLVKFCVPWSAGPLDHPISASFVVNTGGTVDPSSIRAEGDDALLPAIKQYLARCAFTPGSVDGHAVPTRVKETIDDDQN